MSTQANAKKSYVIDGFLLEACSCMAPCPCWIGDDPDGGNCDAFVAHHISQVQIQGVDVSNLIVVQVVQIPGNVLAGNWRTVFYVDDRATPEQQRALLDAWTGKVEGPLAGLAGLVGERISIIAAPIQYDVKGAKAPSALVSFSMQKWHPTPMRMARLLLSTIPSSAPFPALRPMSPKPRATA